MLDVSVKVNGDEIHRIHIYNTGPWRKGDWSECVYAVSVDGKPHVLIHHERDKGALRLVEKAAGAAWMSLL